MLVLSRKTEQKICIGNDIVITVLKVQGEQVSIGIEAPKSLQIVREELLSQNISQSKGLNKSAARENRKSALCENEST